MSRISSGRGKSSGPRRGGRDESSGPRRGGRDESSGRRRSGRGVIGTAARWSLCHRDRGAVVGEAHRAHGAVV
eukprot:4568519-Alexandrium_andersonii.AAC.1